MTGELLALGAAFAFGMSSVAIAKGARNASAESGVFLSAIITGLLSGAAWMWFPGGAAWDEWRQVAWGAIGWFAVSGLLATVGGRITMYRSIEFAGVIRASTIRRLMPLMSLLLSWLVLDERVSLAGGGGMALIAISFVLLYQDNRSSIRASDEEMQCRAMISRGLALGVVSALLYAVSFIARKFGLASAPNALFGAFVGSLTAVGFYVAAAVVSDRYRSIIANVLMMPNPWQLAAALLLSAGQLSQFGALMYASIGRVAFINSVEVYIAAFLSVAVFGTEKIPGMLVIFATVFATAGVLVLATGW